MFSDTIDFSKSIIILDKKLIVLKENHKSDAEKVRDEIDRCFNKSYQLLGKPSKLNNHYEQEVNTHQRDDIIKPSCKPTVVSVEKCDAVILIYTIKGIESMKIKQLKKLVKNHKNINFNSKFNYSKAKYIEELIHHLETYH